MGQFFSDNVEKALQYIYYENKGYARHGQEAVSYTHLTITTFMEKPPFY